MIKKVRRKLRYLRNSLFTSLRKAQKGSDYRRWSIEGNLGEGWDSRTKQIANLVDAGSSVIEFGAGRLVLRQFLPDSCTYTPSDLVDRGAGTIVCDLNSDTLPQFESYNFAVFSGVLEYVNDVPRLLSHLSESVDAVVASYAVMERNEENRRASGWVNDYSSGQFVALFESAGFQCDHTEDWKTQVIYRFRKTT